MELATVVFENGESSLSVRTFNVREKMSDLFEITIVARSPSADLDFEDLIGQGITFTLHNGAANALTKTRIWTGLCSRCEQVRVEADGLSTYELTIVPKLWLLTKRRNHRLFQHKSVVDVAHELMQEWDVHHRLNVSRTDHAALELRIQYGESDYAFMCRLLEEAGISFYFAHDLEKGTTLVFTDEPHGAEPRVGALPFFDEPGEAQSAGSEFVTALRVRREMRPGRVVLRDFDFRKPRYELLAQATAESGLEEKLEQYHYVPGAFKTEGHDKTDTPTADDLGVARADEVAGTGLAKRILEGERSRRRQISFDTNAYDVAPGTTVMVSGHPRAALGTKLLMTALTIRGDVTEPDEWVATGRSVFADSPYRPAMNTEKPRVFGVQSAIIVGPEDETVYTDEFGRVRAQFHWDRQGTFDAQSSAWMRVRQAWAGPGYGLFNLPRVGHEVLVGFVDGDPDQPIVVGRVFNGAQQVPYPLPGSKMMSGWKSDSNSNIILFDDTPGDEMFYTQAEKDKLGIVKRHEAYITGGRRSKFIGTANKTLVTTTDTLAACGNINRLAGIFHSEVGVFTTKTKAGLNATIQAGNKVDIHVQPVLPFITSLLDLKDAKIQIAKTLPQGQAPDLKQVLPAYAGGPQPGSPEAVADPTMTLEETEAALKKELTVVGNAFEHIEQEDVDEMEASKTSEEAVAKFTAKLEEKGGPEAVTAFANAQALTENLGKIEKQQNLKTIAGSASGTSAGYAGLQNEEETDLKTKLLLAILGLIIPKTKMTIKHNKIKLETKKASIEIDKDDIKLEAKGDIEIKADGKVKIEGQSVSISPSPCKCG
jgi:type VI secretion system secreted protein VgrG